MVEHLITISDGSFIPEELHANVGDTVVWDNQDFMSHTASAKKSGNGEREFDTGEIASFAKSAPQSLQYPSGPSGTIYECVYHAGMMGVIRIGSLEQRARAAANVQALNTEATASTTLTTEQWRALSRTLIQVWVYDMADNFEHAVAYAPAGSILSTEWSTIVRDWQGLSGQAVPITDRPTLRSIPQDALYGFGRRLRAAHVRARPERFPNPPRPPGEQSKDPFGKAITIFAAAAEENAAYDREAAYVSSAFGIETRADLGRPNTPAQIADYSTRKNDLSADDYGLLAAHLLGGFSKYLGGAFDADKVEDAVWRMTAAGEWDDPIYVGWHWHKWVEAYISVIETGTVPDLITLPAP